MAGDVNEGTTGLLVGPELGGVSVACAKAEGDVGRLAVFGTANRKANAANQGGAGLRGFQAVWFDQFDGTSCKAIAVVGANGQARLR